MFVFQVLDICSRAAGRVDADEVFADFFVSGDGRADAFGNEQMKILWRNTVCGELAEAEGGHAAAGEHDGEAIIRANDGGGTLIHLGEAAVAWLWLLETAVVESNYRGIAIEPNAVTVVGFAADKKMARAPFANRLSLSHGFGIADADE